MSNIIRVKTISESAEKIMGKLSERDLENAMKSGKVIEGIVVMKYINLDHVISVDDPIDFDMSKIIDLSDGLTEDEVKEFMKVFGFGDMTNAFLVNFSKDHSIVVDGLYYDELIEKWKNVSKE